MTWIKVAESGDIKENSGKEVTANGVKIALFRTTDNYYAIDALCRHQDGSLAPGDVQGEIVPDPIGDESFDRDGERERCPRWQAGGEQETNHHRDNI